MASYINPSNPGMGLESFSFQSAKPASTDKPKPKLEEAEVKIEHEKWHDTTEALLKTSSDDAISDPISTLSMIMGDSFIKGESIPDPLYTSSSRGRPLDTSSFIKPAKSLFYFLKAKSALLESRDKNCELAKSLIKALIMLQGSVQFFVKIKVEDDIGSLLETHRTQKNGLTQRVDFIVEKIKSLKPGEELLIPGGWKGQNEHGNIHPRHDMLYVLRRQLDGRFTISVITLADEKSSSEMQQGAYDGFKYKIKPVRIFPNLPAAMVLSPEPWAAYMKLMFFSPEFYGEEYSFDHIFSCWLPSLGASEELDARALEALNIGETTLQRTEVASADAYFQWLRTMLPSKALYKTLKLEYKAWLLAQGLEKMKKDKLFDPAVSIEDINDKKKKQQIVRAIIEKFSISVKKSLERDELTVQEADQYLAQIKSYLKEIKQADRLLNQTHEKLSIDRAADLTFKATANLQIDGEKCKEEGEAEILFKNKLDIKTTWQEPVILWGQLLEWDRTLSSTKEDRLQVHLTLFKIFKEMPSVGDAYWNAIPEMHREDCMVFLSSLSELFANTASEIKNPKNSRIEYLCAMQQVLAVVKKLSMGILDKEKPIFIDTSYFTHTAHEFGITGNPFIRNPNLEKKLKDTVSFFHDPHKKEHSLMFSGSIVNNLLHPDRSRLSPIHRVDDTGIKLIPEQLYVMDYLKKHPDMKEKIVKDLKSDKEEELPITEHLIIAKALIGDYLPEAFYALRKQAYITQFFCNYPYYYDYSKVEFKKWCFEEDSLGKYIENPQRSIGLRISCKEAITGREAATGKNRFQEAIAPPDDPSYKKAYDALFDHKSGLNDIMIKREYDEIQKEMGLLRTEVDKSQQAVKAVAYFRKNALSLGLLKNQIYFQMLMFEPGVLRDQLKAHPEFTANLLELINEGLGWAKIKNDIPTILFFLRMGDYLNDYCLDCNAPKVEFPNVARETEMLLSRKGLSPQNEWLILREQLASIKRQGLVSKQDIPVVFKKYMRVKALFDPNFNTNYINAPLDDDVTNLGFAMVGDIEALSDAVRQRMFSEAINDTEGLPWELNGSIASTLDYFVQIDLIDGKIYTNGFCSIDTLPEKFANGYKFTQTFGKISAITNIASRGPDTITFKDSFGYTCFAKTIASSSEPIYQKIIQGELCLNSGARFIDPPYYVYLVNECTEWHSSVEPHQIYFLDRKSGQLRYVYNPKLHQLKCVDGPCKGLYLVSFFESFGSKTNKQLRDFDKAAMFWRNKEGRVEVVELSQYGLRLNVEWTPTGCTLNASSPYEGFILTNLTSLPSLPWYKGCLIFQNEEGEQRVVIRNQQRGLDFISQICQYRDYYEYVIDEDGNFDAPENLEAQIYLAYLYNYGHDYEKANALLSRAAMKPPRAYTSHEIEILQWITGDILDYHRKALVHDTPQALAINMKVEALLQENCRRFVTKKHDTDLQYIHIKSYLEQLAHIPEEFLGLENEINVSSSCPVEGEAVQRDRRLNALKGKGTPEKAPHVLKEKGEDKPIEYRNYDDRIWDKTEQLRNTIIAQCAPAIEDATSETNTFYEALLNKLPFLFHYKFGRWVEYFYLLYEFATDKNISIDNPLRLRLLSHLILLHRNPSVHSNREYTEILIAAIKYPENMPAISELMPMKSHDPDFEKRMDGAYKKAYELNHRKVFNNLPRQIKYSAVEPKKAVHLPSQVPTKHAAVSIGPLFSNSLVNLSKSLLIKVESSQKRDDSDLKTRLALAEQEQKYRVERRVISQFSEGIAALESKEETTDTWKLNLDQLENFEANVMRQLSEEEAQIKQARKNIIKLANKRSADPKQAAIEHLAIKGGGKHKLTIDDLVFISAKNDLALYRERNPNLSSEEAQELHLQLEEMKLAATQWEQLKQIKKKLIGCKKCPKTAKYAPLLHERTQQLVKAIKVERAYTLDHKQAHIFSVFEYYLKVLLRPEQVKSISELTQEELDTMLQLNMGGGKTDILAPLLAFANADGDQLSMMVVPDELAELVTNRLWLRSGKGFGQIINRLWWSPGRHSLIRPSHIEEIRKKRQVLLVTEQEMHALQLKIMELRTRICRGEKLNPEEKNQFESLQEVKKVFKTKANAIIDEPHKIFDCRHDSRIALNSKDSKVNQPYVHVAVTWYHQLMCNQKILAAFAFDFMKKRSVSAKPFALSDYDKIKQPLVRSTLQALAKSDIELQEHLKGKAEDIEKFLLAKEGDKIELPVGLSEGLRDKLSFLHSEVLVSPATWNSLPWVKYGLFPDKNGFSLLSGPFESAHCPKIGSQFAHLTELINYTVQMRLLEGVDTYILRNELRRIQDAVQDEMQNTGINVPAKTEAYKEYIEVFGPAWVNKYPLYELDLDNLDPMKAYVDRSPSVLLACLERYILPTIPTYKESLISDGQLLPDMFARAVAFTGTPNADNAPGRFRLVLDKSTDGKTLRTLWNNSKQNVHVLTKENDSLAILKEMLENSETRAILDAGAVFMDIPHRRLAEEILKLRPEMNAVIYFDGNQKLTLLRGAAEPIVESQAKVPVDKRFTIYDQSRCLGADIDQWPTAHAAVTMHKNLTFSNFAQAVARMRGIYDGQVIHLYLTPSQRDLIQATSNKKIENILDPILYMANMQAKQQALDAVVTIKQKMRKLVVQECERILDAATMQELSDPQLRELNDILIVKLPNTFDATYGTVEKLLDDRQALEAFRDSTLKPLNEWLEKYKDSKYAPDKDKLLKAMNAIIDDALLKGKEKVNEQIPVGTGPETGRSMAVATQVDTKAEQTTESQTDTESWNTPIIEELIPTNLKYVSTADMFKKSAWEPVSAEQIEKGSAVDQWPCPAGKQPIIRAKDLTRFLNPEHSSWNLFHPNLYLSYRFISTEVGGKPYGQYQKPAGPCLIIQDKADPKKFSFVLISSDEAEEFKKGEKGLINDKLRPHAEGDVRICLYYLGLGSTPKLEIYQYGSDPISAEDLAASQDFQTLRLHSKLWSSDIQAKRPELEKYQKMFAEIKDITAFHDFYKKHLLRSSAAKKNYYKSDLFKLVFAPLLKLAEIDKLKAGHIRTEAEVKELSGRIKDIMAIVNTDGVIPSGLEDVSTQTSAIAFQVLGSEKDQKIRAAAISAPLVEEVPAVKQLQSSSVISQTVAARHLFKFMDNSQISPEPEQTAIKYEDNAFDDIPCPLGNNISVKIGGLDVCLHANVVRGLDGRAYVASQMPFTKTSQEAHWKALYEHDMTNVLDLTNESDIKRSREILDTAGLPLTYPEQEAKFGSLKVTSVGEPEVFMGGYAKQGWMTHAYRIEDTSKPGNPTKTIYRTHFEGWPDKEVIDCYVLNDLVKYFDKASQFTMPLVNCMAGVGRTGTFITCLRLKQLFEKRKLHKDAEGLMSDIINIILEGRKARGPAFVEKSVQFESIINYAKLLLGDEAPSLEFTRGQIARLITMTKKRSQEIFAEKTASAQAETKERAEQREYKH